MRNFIIFLLILGAIAYLRQTSLQNQHQTAGDGAPSDASATYVEIRFHADVQDRSFNMVALGKADDQADCHRMSDDLVARMQSHRNANDSLSWNLVSTECKKDLDARSEKLFENKPTFVNYVSAAKGDATEREARLIFWGVTANEGDSVCELLVPRMQENRKGVVTCIHALPSQ